MFLFITFYFVIISVRPYRYILYTYSYTQINSGRNSRWRNRLGKYKYFYDERILKQLNLHSLWNNNMWSKNVFFFFFLSYTAATLYIKHLTYRTYSKSVLQRERNTLAKLKQNVVIGNNFSVNLRITF